MIDWPSFRLRAAKKEDCSQFLDEPAMIYVDGVLAAIYCDISHLETKTLVDALRKLKISAQPRSSGMMSNSQTFGFMPRRPLGRGDFCSASLLDRDHPETAILVEEFVEPLVEIYRKVNPSLVRMHEQAADKIRPEWRIHGLYSSGIINRDNFLPYHFDSGNISDCWSIMPVFKQDTEGGHLAVPQLDLCVDCKDHSCLMFDGQSYLHGVTPFRKTKDSGYRLSVVYYTLKQLWDCLPFDEELQRGRLKRTEVEERTAAGKLHPVLEAELARRKEHEDRNKDAQQS